MALGAWHVGSGKPTPIGKDIELLEKHLEE